MFFFNKTYLNKTFIKTWKFIGLGRVRNNKISRFRVSLSSDSEPDQEETGNPAENTTKQKKYLYAQMLFGLRNAPALFCQLMSQVHEIDYLDR